MIELTQAHRIFLDTVNKHRRLLGEPPINEQEFNNLFAEATDIILTFEAMDTYAKSKWEDAVDETFEAIGEAMDREKVLVSQDLSNVFRPQFNP